MIVSQKHNHIKQITKQLTKNMLFAANTYCVLDRLHDATVDSVAQRGSRDDLQHIRNVSLFKEPVNTTKTSY